jgi:hypothetical protein
MVRTMVPKNQPKPAARSSLLPSRNSHRSIPVPYIFIQRFTLSLYPFRKKMESSPTITERSFRLRAVRPLFENPSFFKNGIQRLHRSKSGTTARTFTAVSPLFEI